MIESATDAREQRKRETSRALTCHARQLTSELGFSGFTIEELCSSVGVSRRTFFNYFECKENAVLGYGFATADPREHAIGEDFVAARGDLIDDFVEMIISRWEIVNPVEDTEAMFAAIEDEPRLIKAAFRELHKNELRDVELITRRLGDSPETQLRAEVIVHGIGALIRLALDQLIHHHSTDSPRELLLQRVRIARAEFTTSQKAS
ncbi:TetR/AcrR family transcriptional regulator [Gulosibacter sp. ACHW.36C]|uniref:TetR/AcrR family transcriptional regulator n=1 Tax=Gulosibacter sediminis TaxID=1729695 RepID=A0ABY4N0N7_9MICO|nr:TetR/AcrR family transcriptional regulator [Gulosibacter sediminis]UQN15599.1 TetR/AcrR family transcriptional regulator [Gulosibacter sediminis]